VYITYCAASPYFTHNATSVLTAASHVNHGYGASASIYDPAFARDVRKSQVFRGKSQVKSRVFQVNLKSFMSSPKSLPNLSFFPCLRRPFTNYVTQICVIWTHPTNITYYGDALVNETNTIPPSTILKISLSQSTLSTIHSSTI